MYRNDYFLTITKYNFIIFIIAHTFFEDVSWIWFLNNKKNIFPTPVIGGVGLITKLSKPIGHNFKDLNNSIILIGKTFGHLEQSSYLKENFSMIEGRPPEINLLNEKNNGEVVLNLINKNYQIYFLVYDYILLILHHSSKEYKSTKNLWNQCDQL